MKTLKRILPLTLVLCLCLGTLLLAACTKPETPEEPETPAEKKNFAITVVDQNGDPVEGAKIHFYDAAVTEKGTAVTNAAGIVMIELEAVSYNIVVDAPTGYTAEASYALPAGTTVMTVTLQKADTRPVYTVTVKDMYGDPVPGLDVQMCVPEGNCVLGPTTDATGTSKVTVPAVDSYYVTFPNSAAFSKQYLFDEKYYFEEGAQTIEITLYPNNTPDGTAERPFVFAGEPYTVTLPAGSSTYFVGFGIYNCDFTATGFVGGKLTCGSLTVTAEANGALTATMPMPDPNAAGNTPVQFVLENTGSTAATVTFHIQSKPGTAGNPIALTDLTPPLTVEVKKGAAIYYTYTASAAGTLTASCTDTRSNITLNNLTTSQYGDTSDGAASTTMNVNVGDTVQIIIGTVAAAGQSDVTLTVTLSVA